MTETTQQIRFLTLRTFVQLHRPRRKFTVGYPISGAITIPIAHKSFRSYRAMWRHSERLRKEHGIT